MLHVNKSNEETISFQDTVPYEIGPVGVLFLKLLTVSDAVLFLVPSVSFRSLFISPVVAGVAMGYMFVPNHDILFAYITIMKLMELDPKEDDSSCVRDMADSSFKGQRRWNEGI